MKKIALLGAAHIHTPDFVRRLLARKDFNVVGVWDHDSERANLNAQKFGCQICSSVQYHKYFLVGITAAVQLLPLLLILLLRLVLLLLLPPPLLKWSS